MHWEGEVRSRERERGRESVERSRFHKLIFLSKRIVGCDVHTREHLSGYFFIVEMVGRMREGMRDDNQPQLALITGVCDRGEEGTKSKIVKCFSFLFFFFHTQNQM